MSPQDAQPVSDDRGEALRELEMQAEYHAPGVLELLETYGRVDKAPTPWTPINASAVSYSTNTNPPS